MTSRKQTPAPELDQPCEQILRGVGQAEPSDDFHSRLLKNLNERERSTAKPRGVGKLQSARWTWLAALQRSHFTARPAVWLAAPVSFALLLLIAVLGTWALHRSHSTTPGRDVSQQPPRMHAHSPSATAAEQVHLANLPPPPSPPASTSVLLPPIKLEVTLRPVPVNATHDPDSEALADLAAPSQPSPPLPLTAQERLLRLMTRRAERHDLAQLDSTEMELKAQQEQAAFQKFFAHPLPPHQAPNQSRGPNDPGDVPLEALSPPDTTNTAQPAPTHSSQTSPQPAVQGQPQ